MEIVVPEDIENMYKNYAEDDTAPKNPELKEFMMSWSAIANAIYIRGYKAGHSVRNDSELKNSFWENNDLFYSAIISLEEVHDLWRLLSDNYLYEFEIYNFEERDRMYRLFEKTLSNAIEEIKDCDEKYSKLYTNLMEDK